MSAAIAAMTFAALETELALHRLRTGDLERLRTHGGWAVILCAAGLFCAFFHWVFG